MTPNPNLKNSTAPFRQPPAPKLYTGPAVPTAYDPQFQTYTNLLSDPKYAAAGTLTIFQSMPENLTRVAGLTRHNEVMAVMPKITPDMTLAQVQAALDAAKAAVAVPFATEQSVLTNIGKTVKTQGDVVRMFKGT